MDVVVTVPQRLWADEVVMTGGWRSDRYDEIALPPHSQSEEMNDAHR